MIITGALLGHRNPLMTARYAHLQDSHLHEAAERMAGRVQEWLENGHAASADAGAQR